MEKEEDIADVEANFVAPDDHETGPSTGEDIYLRSIYQQVVGIQHRMGIVSTLINGSTTLLAMWMIILVSFIR